MARLAQVIRLFEECPACLGEGTFGAEIDPDDLREGVRTIRTVSCEKCSGSGIIRS